MNTKIFKIAAVLTEMELFQLASLCRGLCPDDIDVDDPDEHPLKTMAKKMYDASRKSSPAIARDADILTRKFQKVFAEPSVERGAFQGGAQGLMETCMDALSEKDKDRFKKYDHQNGL